MFPEDNHYLIQASEKNDTYDTYDTYYGPFQKKKKEGERQREKEQETLASRNERQSEGMTHTQTCGDSRAARHIQQE